MGPGTGRQDLFFWPHGGPLKNFEKGLHTTLLTKWPFEALLGLLFVGVFDCRQNRTFLGVWLAGRSEPIWSCPGISVGLSGPM